MAGLDATQEFIDIARQRTPDGEFEVGEMVELPWQDDSFDVVTGFNSFFLADDMIGALREARRVARPGGTLALTIFGRPEQCDSTTLFASMRRLVEGDAIRSGESESGTSRPPALHQEAVILGIAREAGLEPTECAYFQFTEEYPDVETMLRGMLAAPPGRKASLATSLGEVREALTEAVQPHVNPSGAVQLREGVRYLIANS